MDLRAYYQKICKVEAEISEPYVVLVSRETPEGGKPGVKTDVPRSLAAKLIVEDQATLATPEEAAQFRTETARRRRAVQGPEPRSARRQAANRKNQRQ
jgi:hypothetical protein